MVLVTLPACAHKVHMPWGRGSQRYWLSSARQGDNPQSLSGSVLRQGLDKLSRLAFQFMILLPQLSES